MRVVESGFTPSEYVEQLRTAEMSFGTRLIPVGGVDEQTPHAEDEIYAVTRGRARIVTPSGSADAGPGSVIFVPAREEHRFVEITAALTAPLRLAGLHGTRDPIYSEPAGVVAGVPWVHRHK